MTDEEIADQLDCDRTYLSKLRNGKQNPGPKITRRLQSLLDDGPSADGGTAFGGSVERFLEEARHLAKRAGTDVESFLERLLDSHGLEVALELKKEREAAANTPPALPPSKGQVVAKELIDIAVSEVKKGKKL